MSTNIDYSFIDPYGQDTLLTDFYTMGNFAYNLVSGSGEKLKNVELTQKVSDILNTKERKTAFENDLHALKNRSSFSFYCEAARLQSGGLAGVVTKHVVVGVMTVAIGIASVYALALEGATRPAHALAPLLAPAGIILVKDDMDYFISKGERTALKAIVDKHLGSHISKVERSRLMDNILESWKKRESAEARGS